MKIVLYVALTLLVVASCEDAETTEPSELEKGDVSPEKINDAAEEPVENEDIPILPPIILLDFADDNSTDEKSKRTIESGLGYGYLQNNLLNGKFNYYFPGGKTGTTVSIEESISPFEPKTIIEPFKPITEKPINEPTTTYQPNVKPSAEALTLRQHPPALSSYATNHQIFGQRTKLQKYSPPDHYNPGTYQSTPKSAYTTIRPQTYATPKPAYQNAYSGSSYTRPTYDSYATTAPTPAYDSRYNVPFNHRAAYEATTARPLPSDPAAFNLPKYTIENGVRYEHKIVWKYPDGRIANGPPTSYVNSYSEYTPPQKAAYQASGGYKTISHPQQTYDSQEVSYSQEAPSAYQAGYQAEPVSNIYNQRPAQFPMDQESYPSRTAAPTGAGVQSQAQNFDLSYQSKYGLRPRDPTRFEPSRPISKYRVDSSNAEYTTASPNLFTQSGQLTPHVLSKYTPQAQKYLTKVFKNQSNIRDQYHSQASQYNANYENLLNYNPSISQYIRDPSSILQAQPTFIQAGNSLIPVIILRVDGAPPVQPKPTPSINLKALLQQYLSQYADSKAALSQTSYEYKDPKPFDQNTLSDLTRLTQVLSRFSQNQEVRDSSVLPIQKLANHPLDYDSTRYHSKTSYDTVEKAITQGVDESRHKYGNRVGTKQKVKSVQIIGNS